MDRRHKVFKSGFKLLNVSGLGRFLAPVTQGCGAVFMMHHVRPASDNAFKPNAHLSITPEFLRFAVNRIREKGYEILHLDEAVGQLKSGYGNKRYAVLTFDDGYRDNLDVAYPVLKELGAPFSVFVTSGLIDRTSELWWVAIERLVAENSELVISGQGGESPISCATPEEKVRCFDRLMDILGRDVQEPDQRAITRALAERYGLDLAALADEYMMTWDELRGLAADPLVTIGAHTHDHYALARMSEGDAWADIDKGMQRIEQELGLRPRHFAYPYGKAFSVCDRDADYLERSGFSSALTTFPGVLNSASARTPMKLPRISLNGLYQTSDILDQYLTGAPFALYKAANWLAGGFGIKSSFSRLFPSTR